jgi:N-acetyl-gamma-glutamyl-phosphate reductase
VRVGIVGASGFVGGELLRLLLGRDDLQVAAVGASSHAGDEVGAVHPGLQPIARGMRFVDVAPEAYAGLDAVVVAVPHGAAEGLVAALVGQVGSIVDLSADFRLRDPDAYPVVYGRLHGAPELLERFVPGIPELFRDAIHEGSLVAVPGCYPTAALLALAPFERAGLLADGAPIVVDAASGVSGAGNQPTPRTSFCTVDEAVVAYGVLDHRHVPEMEQQLKRRVLFVPHLAPMSRGILATCYASLATPLSTNEALAVLRGQYDCEPFVVVGEEPPSTKWALGSNTAFLSARVDERSHWLIVLSAIDNLGKGAAGQAVQCLNLVLGLPETAGLPVAGLVP